MTGVAGRQRVFDTEWEGLPYVFGVWEAGGDAGWHVSLSRSDAVREAGGGDGNGD